MTTTMIEPAIDAIADAAITWARDLGAMALERSRRPLTIEFKAKGRRDPVTEVDRAVETRIRELVDATFPGHAVLGEENPSTGDEPEIIWVVDPIDGTANYARGLPLWAISIGVLRGRQPIAAAIYTPAGPYGSPAVYSARYGGGAYCDGDRILVVPNRRPEPTGLIGMPGYWPLMFRRTGKLRRTPGEPRVLGSVAIELAQTAAGVLQYSVFGGPKIWDVAAGVLIVQEAGGAVLQQQGKQWLPLVTFDPPARKADEAPLAALARWRAPIIAGNPLLARYVSDHLSPSLMVRLFLLWRRLRPRKG